MIGVFCFFNTLIMIQAWVSRTFKNLKIILIIVLKMEQFGFYITVICHPKDAYGRANSSAPDEEE